MSIWNFRELLPDIPREHQISLGEGNTPLLKSRRIGPSAGLHRLYFKLESSNPTGSYKDRFAAAAVSHMRAAGQTLCVATSSGNTGSALAAYCAAAAIDCRIAIVETAPEAKLLQMLAYGAKLFRVRGFGIDPQITDSTFSTLATLADRPGAALQISAFKYSPRGMAGVQTIAYEIENQLESPQHVFSPAGGGGLTLAVARGFQQIRVAGRHAAPKIHCVQPAGNDTIAGPMRAGKNRSAAVRCTTTISGLQVPSVIDGNEVIEACRTSGGTGHTVTDDEVFAMQQRLAREEGIFCEPAGAVAAAGALAAAARDEIGSEDAVVCLVTGSGFKDLASAERLTDGAACETINCGQLSDYFNPHSP
ncbi:MAG: pyridoxal-phosphate dependent enzyme [Pirellulales bacterium]